MRKQLLLVMLCIATIGSGILSYSLYNSIRSVMDYNNVINIAHFFFALCLIGVTAIVMILVKYRD